MMPSVVKIGAVQLQQLADTDLQIMATQELFRNSALSAGANITNALVQLLSLPVLLHAYGSSEYGLIVLAMSLNTFIAILQMGMPTAFPKFVAEWLAKGDRKVLESAGRTVSSLYVLVAIVNFLILIIVAEFRIDIFEIKHEQYGMLQDLLLITAATSLFSLPANALDQALTGAQQIGFISLIQLANNLLFAALVLCIFFAPNMLSLSQFYAIRCLIMFVGIPFKLRRWNTYGSAIIFVPGGNIKAAMPLLKYSFALISFAIFIILADRARPLILAIQTSFDAGKAMTEFQILNNFKMFLAMLASSLLAVLIPHVSGAAAAGNMDIYAKTISEGTRYMWTALALLGFGLMMLSSEVLMMYVGVEYVYLDKWLMLMVGGALYNLYITPISSAILSSGKLFPMIVASSSGCCMSLMVCWWLAPRYGVGAIPISLITYNFIHFYVTHWWYLPKYFHIDTLHHVWRIILPPIFAGIVMLLGGRYVLHLLGPTAPIISIAIGAVVGTLLYGTVIMLIHIRPAELKVLFARLKNT